MEGFYFPAHPQLCELIVCYWLIQTRDIPRHTKMLPDGYSDLMLNFGSPYEIIWPNGSKQEISSATFFGQRTGYLLLNQQGEVNMIGIRFMPGAEYLVTGIHAVNLANRATLLESIAGNSTQHIEAKLKDRTLTDTRKIALVEELLLSMIQHTNVHAGEKEQHVIRQLRKLDTGMSVTELSLFLGMSYKQTERYFRKHVGLTPKMYMRIRRFHAAFSQVRSTGKADWLSVLFNCGYYDQAHFIKDFRYFAGTSPARQLSVKDTIDEVFAF